MIVKQYIGVDMAKAKFDACFDDASSVKTYHNTKAGLKHFFNDIKKKGLFLDEDSRSTSIGVESTGIYHTLLCLQAKREGYQIKVINPIITNKYNQRNLRGAKTDTIDARIIRYCLIEGEGYAFSETSESLAYKQILREREYLCQLKTRLRIRKHSDEFRRIALGHANFTVNPEIIAFIEVKMKKLESKLREYRKEEQKILQSIPGIGAIISATFIIEVQDINKFKKPNKLIAFIGTDPKVQQSGSSIDKQRYITKRGNRFLRSKIYMAASIAVLRPNQFQTYFKKKISQGKPYRVAIIATANKMVRVIHSIWTKGIPYKV